MAVQVLCPKCRSRLAVPDDNVGKVAHCPGCGANVQLSTQPVVPTPEWVTALVDAVAPAHKPATR